jgi:hypothetical protein
LRLTDIAPIELARQLTIIEFGNFQRIKPVECLHKAWNDEDEQAAPNVRRVIHTANKLAGWVSLLVLQPRDPKSRATVMKFFIQTAAVSFAVRCIFSNLHPGVTSQSREWLVQSRHRVTGYEARQSLTSRRSSRA